MKNKLREREREREREVEVTILCEKTMYRMEDKTSNYSKMMKIKRVKIKEDKMIEKE